MTADSRRGPAEPPGLRTQRREVEALLRECELRAGDSWYVVDRRWFEQWREFVEKEDQNSSSYPGPIDNTELFEDLGGWRLKERLGEEEDFLLLPEAAWTRLLGWYGQVEGQPALERKVVSLAGSLQVEVFPLQLLLCLHSSMENPQRSTFSRTQALSAVRRAACEAFGVPGGAECRLWVRSPDSSERIRNMNLSLMEAGISPGTTVIMETRNDDGTWPSSRPQIMRNSLEEQDSFRGQPGVCGLTNLGNTCFMNSALQCLSNTPPLTEYFLLNSYLEELNFSNPLGMGGEIAEAYADLVKQIWSGRHSSVVPRLFKTKVGHFASQFLGYQQHDSQELLSFLLDGLHEDLNRVKNKEYVELRDAAGRPDQEVAEEAWRNHRRRNDSVIVDTFHGLFKSTLVCPECHTVSVTFDPFCYLSVPLPVSKERVMEVFFVSLDPLAKPVQHRVLVPKAGAVGDLCSALSEMTGVAPAQMVVADVFNHRFYKIYTADEALSCILDRDDIFVYELGAPLGVAPEGVSQGGVAQEGVALEGVAPEGVAPPPPVLLALYLRERSAFRDYGGGGGAALFGHPLLMMVDAAVSQQQLYGIILQRLGRYVRPPDPEELEEEEEEEELYKNQTNGISDDEPEEAESAGPGDSSPDSQSESPAAPQHAEASLEHGDASDGCRGNGGDAARHGDGDGDLGAAAGPQAGHAPPSGHAPPAGHAPSTSGGPAPSPPTGPAPSTSGDHAPPTGHAPSTSGDHAPSTSGDHAPSTSGDHAPSTSGDHAPATDHAPSPPASGPPPGGGSQPAPCGETTEDGEEGKQGEARSPSPPANQLPAKRRACRKRRRSLFTIQAVNSTGTTERAPGAMSLGSQPYVAIDWDPDMKRRFYNENEAEKYLKHVSMEAEPELETVQLQACIQTFTTRETLQEENPWFCPVCKRHRLATKKLDLWALPEVLVIHLKRFCYTRFTRQKLDTVVEFPLRDLDLSGLLLRRSSLEPPSRYDLIAVSNHYGGLRDGHYTSFARNKDSAHWFYFDDSKVTSASEEQIMTNAAYVLFYHRQDKMRRPSSPAPPVTMETDRGPAPPVTMETD